MKRKLFCLLTLLLAVCSGAWGANVTAAGNTWPDANCCVFDNSTTQKGSISFSATVNAWNGNAKGCKFNGNTWGSKTAKGDSKFVVSFTTEAVSTITIVQSLKDTGSNRGKVGVYLNNNICSKTDASSLVFQTYSDVTATGIVNASTNTDSNSEVRIYKFYNMAAGDYTIKSGPDCQTSVAYIGVTYESTTPYTISTGMVNGGASTVSGAGSYFPNDSIKLAAAPGAGKAFTKWSTDGGTNEVSTANPYYALATANTTYTAVFADASTKSISVVRNNDDYGTASATTTTIAASGTTTLTASANTGYAFVNWTKSSDGGWTSTTNPLTVGYDDITDGETYTANFKQLYKITYSKGSYAVGSQNKYFYGNILAYANANDEITMPTNYGIVYSAEDAATYTLTAWVDGSGNEYTPGETYTLTGDLTLTPKFTHNNYSIAHLNAAKTVTWEFGSDNGAPSDIHVESADGYYVRQTTIEGESIDVPLYMNNTSGKFVVGTTRSQVNSGSKFCVPASKGMVVTYTANVGTPAANQFAVDDDTNTEISVSGKNISFIYTGTNSSLTITDNNGGYWPERLTVNYPAIATPVEPEGDIVVTETWTKNSSGTNVIVMDPDSKSSCITNGLNLQSNSFGSYSKGWKIESDHTVTIAVPANVSNSKITFYMDGAVTKFNINGEATASLTNTNWDAGNSATGKQVTIELPSSSTITNYVIGKNNGNPNIYKIVYTYTIEFDDVTMTTSENMAGWRSFVDATQAYTIKEGETSTKAYIATSVGENAVVLSEYDGTIYKNMPVLLKTDRGDRKILLTKNASNDSYVGSNELKVTTAGKPYTNILRLGYGTPGVDGAVGVGFYPYSTASAPAGVVYLDAPVDARALSIVFEDEDETTAINAALMNNERMNNEVYNLNGQRVAQPTKGLYIVNGRKVVIK